MDVLIVEDDKGIGEALCRVMELHGFSCDVAKSVEEGLRKLKQCKRVLLVDLYLEDGLASPLIKTCQKEFPDITIVLMTGYPLEPIRSILSELKVDRIIKKPFGLEDLEQIIC